MWTWHSHPQLPAEVNKRLRDLQVELNRLDRLARGARTADDGDTAPSVLGIGVLRTANTGATTVTDFEGGIANQFLTVVFGDGNTTLDHGSAIVLDAGSDFTGSAGDVKQFVLDGAAWREIPTG